MERFHDRGPAVGVFDAFFGAAAAGLALLDDQLRYLQVNKALAEITGKPIADHLGRTIAEVLPEAAHLMEPALRHVLRSAESIDKVPFELRSRAYIGTFFPVFDEARVVRGLGMIIMDVTEHKRLERELRAAVELRERVLAVVSHDLRNPLNTIELAMTTLPSVCTTDRDAAKRIDIVTRAAKVMENLIGDLLDVATIQAGKLTLRLADEDAPALVHESITLHASLAAEKRIALVDETRLADTTIHCDRVRVLQVLANLIGNAIKFCKPSDQITIRGEAGHGTLDLEVSDSGPGIPTADIPRLFEPYWTTARGHERGTGLGLFITKAIVEAHRGTINVHSVVGEGTSFQITLPLH